MCTFNIRVYTILLARPLLFLFYYNLLAKLTQFVEELEP